MRVSFADRCLFYNYTVGCISCPFGAKGTDCDKLIKTNAHVGKVVPKKVSTILCSCGRLAERVYTDPQCGSKSNVCLDCYDIEECQDTGNGVTGEHYSEEEARAILISRGWKSNYS